MEQPGGILDRKATDAFLLCNLGAIFSSKLRSGAERLNYRLSIVKSSPRNELARNGAFLLGVNKAFTNNVWAIARLCMLSLFSFCRLARVGVGTPTPCYEGAKPSARHHARPAPSARKICDLQTTALRVVIDYQMMETRNLSVEIHLPGVVSSIGSTTMILLLYLTKPTHSRCWRKLMLQ